MNLENALTEFYYARDFSPSARTWYHQKLTAWIAWCQQQQVTDVSQVDMGLLRRYLAHLHETPAATGKPMSSHTRHGYARAIRAYVNFCMEEGLLPYGTLRKGLMPKRDQQVKPIFSPKEIDALVAACKRDKSPFMRLRDRALVTLLLDTGIRANELCTLTLDQVVFSVTDAHILVNGKGRKQRQVALTKVARLALHRYIFEARPPVAHAYVFLTRTCTPLQPEGLAEVLNKLRDRTGLRFHINPHKFRHTYAYLYMQRYNNVLTLSRSLGHGSVVVTEQYLKSFGSVDASKGIDAVYDWKSGR